MDNTKKERLPFLLKLVSTLLTLLIGVFFLVALGRIYFSSPSDGKKYTPESVSSVQVFFYVALGLFILGIGISIFLAIRYPKSKISYQRNLQEEYLFIRKYHSFENQKEEDRKAFIKLRKKDRIVLIVFVLCSLVLLVFPIGYLVQIRNFDALGDISKNTISLAIHTLPFLFGIYILAVIYLYYRDNIISKEMELLRKSHGVLPSKKDRRKEEITKMVIQFMILVVAITFIIVGVINGEARSVLLKAINICTECIGLG